MEVANFFWHGRPLSLYDSACIASFVRQGFRAIVWTYGELLLPCGAEIGNANEIIPESYLNRFHVEGSPSLAAFSDAFRFALLRNRPGWWFDADVFCLKHSDEFRALRKGRPITIGRLHHMRNDWLESSVLFVEDNRIQQSLVDRVSRESESSNFNLYWGQIGPVLLYEVVKEYGLLDSVLDQSKFFPTHFHDDFFDGFLPEKNAQMKERFETALCYHLWQNQFKRFGIPGNILPPKGSALFDIMLESDSSLVDKPSLEYYCIERLNALKQIGDRWRYAKRTERKRWEYRIPHFGGLFRRGDNAREAINLVEPLIPD